MRTKTFFSSTKALTAGLIAFAATALHAQVGINNTGATPDASAVLDLNTGTSGTMGFLAPQVALTNVTSAAPVTAPATGLIVYSTTAPSGGDGTGYYYWNGTSWITLGTGSAATSLTGAGTAQYVAVWSSASNLTTGLIQDNGSDVGVNSIPYAGYIFVVEATTGVAMEGVTADGTGYGAAGYNSGTSGIGIYGTGIEYGIEGDGNYYGGGSGGYFTDGTDYAAIGDVTNGNGVTAYGANYGGDFSDANGDYFYAGDDGVETGGYGYGTSLGVEGIDPAGDYGLLGNGNFPGNGVFGYGTAVGGYFYDTQFDYVYIADQNAGASYGVYALATDVGGGYAAVYGEDDAGEAIEGVNNSVAGDPVYGLQNDGAGDCFYGVNTSTGASVLVNYYDGTTQWKVTGVGTAGTSVKTPSGDQVRLSCPETPEIYFEDYGQGQLVNGKAHIDLDPTIAKNVTISEKHPLRAFIQLEGDCNGVFVTNKSATGFDVVELKGGTSNTSFQWHIICNRADEVMKNGIVSHNADMRFPKDITLSKVAAAESRAARAKLTANVMKPSKNAAGHIKVPVAPVHHSAAAGTDHSNTQNSK